MVTPFIASVLNSVSAPASTDIQSQPSAVSPISHSRVQALRTLAIATAASTMLAFAPLSAAHAQDIDYINATFSVGYNSDSGDGNSRLTVQRNGSSYEAVFAAEHVLLDIRQKASFTMKQCQVKPQSYSNSANPAFKSHVKEDIVFNWEQKQALYSNNSKEQKSFSLISSLYDPLSFFFEARCDLIAGKTRFTYPLIYKGNERKHTYVITGKQLVKTGIGDIEALVVQRERNNQNRITRFYVAPGLDYMLVKIEHRESALAQASATLQSLDYKVAHP